MRGPLTIYNPKPNSSTLNSNIPTGWLMIDGKKPNGWWMGPYPTYINKSNDWTVEIQVARRHHPGCTAPPVLVTIHPHKSTISWRQNAGDHFQLQRRRRRRRQRQQQQQHHHHHHHHQQPSHSSVFFGQPCPPCSDSPTPPFSKETAMPHWASTNRDKSTAMASEQRIILNSAAKKSKKKVGIPHQYH